MSIKYEDYLGTGTNKLMEFLSSTDIDEGEREAVVTAFSGELADNICDTENLEDSEALIYRTSLEYNDGKISEVLANNAATYSDYEKAIKRCCRVREMMQLFAAKKWSIPRLRNSNLDKCEESLRKLQESTSISNKIIDEDRKIDKMKRTAQAELSVQICDIVLGLLDELANDIVLCKKKKVALPAINNKDTKKAVKKMNELRKIAEQKEAFCQRIEGIDLQIQNIVTLQKTSEEQWHEVISLCEKQVTLLAECSKKQWPAPIIRNDNPRDIANKYRHYLSMNSLDAAIFSNRGLLSSRKQYKTFFVNCSQQANNIETCRRNQWTIPDLNVSDPNGLAAEVQKEKVQKDKTKKLKRTLILILVGVIALFALAVFCIGKYREGKAQIPFDDSYVGGESLDLIYQELDDAGFTDIQKVQDNSGWYDNNEVISVSIDNKLSYTQGTYVNPDVSVIITYCSSGRIYVTDLLSNWAETNYQTICDALKTAGFTNINTKAVDTSDKNKDALVSSLTLNGLDYSNEYCYLPKNAPITVAYYTLKIGIGNSSSEFIGQDYQAVVQSLKESGFTKVQTEEINTGWTKGNSVIGVTVNNTDSYNSNQSFEPDVKIVVKYSSNDRVDATAVLKNWSTQDYETIQKKLKAKGFSNITVKEKITDNKATNHQVASVTINGASFKSGDCYVQKGASIVIEYYALKISVGESAKSLTSNTEGKYSSVVTSLQNIGFSNIQVLRNNSLVNGWITKEGSIESISIDGNDAFSETDAFYYDAPVVIVVNTFKNKGCEDITQIAQ